MEEVKLRFGLFQRALLLVALPVIFQIGFLLAETMMLQQAEREVKRETCARSLLAHVRVLTKAVTSSAAIGYATISGRVFLERYQKAISEVSGEVQQLEALGGLDAEQVQKLRRFGKSIEELKRGSDEGRRLLDAGKTKQGAALLDSLSGKLASVWASSEDVLDLLRKIEGENPAIQTRTRQDLQTWLWVGVLFNISLAIVLAVIFHRGTMKRLSNVMQNAVRLSEGAPLSPPVAGSDEVAHLDKKFHEMATKEQALVRSLAIARDQALEASRFKTEFLANMSHELRTPMSAVIGMTDVLLDTPVSGEQCEMITGIRKAGEVQLSVISDILDLSKIEAGKLKFETSDFELIDCLEDVTLLLADNARQKGVTLTRHVDEAVPRTVTTDQSRLRQVLLNLTANAVKFTSRGSVSISVTVDEVNNERTILRFAVKDTGVGLSAAAISRMFKPYSQADNTISGRYGGTGLGLCISKNLVELMGGHVGVESTEGKGSTFWFTLPQDTRSKVTSLQPATEPTRAQSSAPKIESTREDLPAFSVPAPVVGLHSDKPILVAEDDELHRQVTAFQVQKLGFPLDVATNGREAVEAVAQKDYCLVLMDCEMPELNGFEATSAIRNMEALGKRTIPIVAMTANAVDGYRERCLAAGMDDYVVKPATIGKLGEVLARWISQDSSERTEESPCALSEAPALPNSDLIASDTRAVPVNIDEFLSVLGRQGVQKILRTFLTTTDAYVVELGAAISDKDANTSRRVAHKLKGASSSVNANQLASDSCDLECALRKGDWEEIASVYAVLRASAERAQRYVQENFVDSS